MKKFFKTLCGIVLSAGLLFNPGTFSTITSANTISATTIKEDTQASLQEYLYQVLSEARYEMATDENGKQYAVCNADISAYNLKNNDENVSEIMFNIENLLNCYPELFYISRAYSMSAVNGVLSSINFEFQYDVAELPELKEFFNQEMENIYSQIDSSWTDLEKIVFAHDYIAQHFEYDLRAFDPETVDYCNYDAYSFFRDGVGVCQAYTALFCGLMHHCDIEVSTATSDEEMGHIWNIVKLNGKWYHVDVTWDDPVVDNFSMASHDYLLLSDTAISDFRGGSNDNHRGWRAIEKCTDTTFDNAYWYEQRINSPLKKVGNDWFYINFNPEDSYAYLNSTNDIAKSGKSISQIGRWTDINNPLMVYQTAFSGLDTHKGYVIYNAPKMIMAYNPTTGKNITIHTFDDSSATYGLNIEDDKLYFGSTQDFDPASTQLFFNTLEELDNIIAKEEQTPSTIIKGDADLNGEVNLDDVLLVLKVALKVDSFSISGQHVASDVNGDTEITLDDVLVILKIALHVN